MGRYINAQTYLNIFRFKRNLRDPRVNKWGVARVWGRTRGMSLGTIHRYIDLNFGDKKIFQKGNLRMSAFIHFYEMLSQLLVQFYRARSFTAVAPYALIAGE